MERIKIDRLAVDVFKPVLKQHEAAVVLVHGAYGNSEQLHSYGQFFADHGWNAYAVSLSGHSPSDHEARLAVLTLNRYAEDVQKVVKRLELQQVVLIGHSMGGSVVQKAAENMSEVKALVLLASGPPRGVPFTVTKFTRGFKLLRQIVISIWSMMRSRPMQPVYAPARLAVLNGLSEADSQKVFQMFVPESWVAASQVTKGIPVQAEKIKAPVLVGHFGQDAFIKESMEKGIAKFYQGDYILFDHLAHMGILEPGWQEGCNYIERWLQSKNL